ncbi:hypothetical protein ACJX0J_030175, partial [Zea mays]
ILGKQERGRGGQGHNRGAKLIQSGPFCRPHLDGFTVPPPHRDHGEGAGWLALGPPQPAARRDKGYRISKLLHCLLNTDRISQAGNSYFVVKSLKEKKK